MILIAILKMRKMRLRQTCGHGWKESVILDLLIPDLQVLPQN